MTIAIISCAMSVCDVAAEPPWFGAPGDLHAAGGASADEAAAPTLRSRAESLKVDRHIKVVQAKGELRGTFAALHADSMDVVVEEPKYIVTHRVALTSVESLWTRKSYTSVGGLVGMLLGVGVAAIVVSGAECEEKSFLDEEYYECEYSRVGAYLLGILVGGGVGAIVGHQIHSYEQIYP